jgi:2-desacetyl-2-hydroxyethyl bacteriochlorophyllide A dehydrogenase
MLFGYVVTGYQVKNKIDTKPLPSLIFAVLLKPMKAIGIQKYGGIEELRLLDLSEPVPGENEVLIGVRAASVNPVDWKIRQGRLKFLSGRRFPLIMGTEVAGVVEKTGTGVEEFQPGDRVFAGLSHRGGGYAEKVVARVDRMVKLPDELSFEEAATLAVAGVTAYQSFTLHYPVQQGDHVLVNNGSGGVGTYAVQIARILGAHVTAVCSGKNAKLVRSLGAHEVIDYTTEDFRTRKEAYHVILDAAANAFYPDSKRALKKGGMLIKLNFVLSSLFYTGWTRLFTSRRLKVILVKNRKEDIQWLMDRIVEGAIRVVIDRTFPLEAAREAHEYSESGRARGKIVLLP